MRRCNHCGRENDDAISHCHECGTNLQASPLGPSLFESIQSRVTKVAKLASRASNRQKLLVAISLVLLAAVLAYVASGYLHRPRMSITEVTQVSDAAAEAEGFRLSEYEAPEAKFEFHSRNRTWWVIYSLKLPTRWGPPLPKPRSAHGAPNRFFVIVDDKSKRTQVGAFQAIETRQVKLPSGVKVLGYETNAGWKDSNKN